MNLGIVFKAQALDALIDRLLERSGLERAQAQPAEPTPPDQPTDADEALGDAA